MRMRGHSAHDWPCDERYEPYFERLGLLPFVLQFKRHAPSINHGAMTALIDRWRPETHSFHLSCGEMTVTLEDMAMISGLPINGEALTGTIVTANWRDRVGQLTGVFPLPPEEGERDSEKVLHHWLLEERGVVCPPDANEVVVQQHARAYLWYLLTRVVFPDSTGNKAQWIFLDLLSDWDRKYSWGSGALAYLYRQVISNQIVNLFAFAISPTSYEQFLNLIVVGRRAHLVWVALFGAFRFGCGSGCPLDAPRKTRHLLKDGSHMTGGMEKILGGFRPSPTVGRWRMCTQAARLRDTNATSTSWIC